jgi:hypothetical protein
MPTTTLTKNNKNELTAKLDFVVKISKCLFSEQNKKVDIFLKHHTKIDVVLFLSYER